jgi:predicted transcriptional regulator
MKSDPVLDDAAFAAWCASLPNFSNIKENILKSVIRSACAALASKDPSKLATYQSISAELGVPLQTVARHMRELEKDGTVFRATRTKHGTSYWAPTRKKQG